MKKTLLALLFMLIAPSAMAQSTVFTCSAAAPIGPIIGPNTITFLGSPEHSTVTSYKIGVFSPGIDPNAITSKPLTEVTIDKSSLVASTTETNCYKVAPDMGILLATPIVAVTPYVASMQAIRTTDATVSLWSTVSNPFVKAGPPPGPPSALKISK